MAEKITPRSEDFSEWYHDIVLKARLADYSPVKGCMVIRPNGYALWEVIQEEMNRRIKAAGVRNAYFPALIPESFLKREAEHVEGFAPELAIVTHAGGKKLEENLVFRPTSETIINSMFSKWIQSYRDLPLLINQWANVVRWEMRTRLFLRTTEFLWQEGHTCHIDEADAEAFTRRMLEVYADFSEKVLAMPVIPGMKTDRERFAGAVRTYCIEAMMQDRKALQAGTSHYLGQNFAKAFDTQFLDKDGKQKYVHQTSWGVSTRLIGGMVMTHSDDKGLVLPPRLAPTHIVMVPFLNDDARKGEVLALCEKVKKEILDLAFSERFEYPVQIHIDTDETKQSGWKFHEYELTGVPIRLEIGPRDIDKGQAVFVRRDIGKKEFMPLAGLAAHCLQQLPAMQNDLFEKAKKYRDENTFKVTSYGEFKLKLEEPGGFFWMPWGGDSAAEGRIKEETKATIRCIPLDKDYKPIPANLPCVATGKTEGTYWAIFAKSY